MSGLKGAVMRIVWAIILLPVIVYLLWRGVDPQELCGGDCSDL